MRILYGVQTTGNGHLSSSYQVISHLKTLGHEVYVIFSGANNISLWDLSAFEPYTVYRGTTFVDKYAKADALKTLLKLDIQNFYHDIWTFNAKRFDLVISDFEPVSAQIAYTYGIKSIGLSHQCAFIYDVPKAPLNYLGKLIMRIFAPVTMPIGLHWYHFDQPILPPIINQQLCCNLPVQENKILVYMPFENRQQLKQQLQAFPDYDFHIYEKRDQIQIENNLHWHSLSRAHFLHDLKTCSGVICQAGFQLPSEALHLGKKLLLTPMQGQYEQSSNVIAMNKLGCAHTTHRIDVDGLQHWLQQPMIEPAGYPDVARVIAQWISADLSLSVGLLSQYLWDKTAQVPLYRDVIAA